MMIEDEKQKPAMGTQTQKNDQFCILCGKYVDDELSSVPVGIINFVQPPKGMIRIPVVASACKKCVVVMNNANRIYQEAKVKFQKEIFKFQKEGSDIIVPELALPDDFMKKLKS